MTESQPLQEKAVPQPQTAPENLPTPIKPNKAPMVVMIIVTALSLLLSGYLAYQNIQLKGQIEQPTAPPAPTETPDPMESWETYEDKIIGFSIQYPNNYSLEFLGGQPVLNRRLTWFIDQSIKDQRGDLPIIKSEEAIKLGGTELTKYYLEMGEVGGTIPQMLIRYEMPIENQERPFLVFNLTEFPQQLTPEEINLYKAEPTSSFIFKSDLKSEEQIADQILSTFEFLE